MIGNKKLLLTLGSISAVAAPVAAVISCGAESKVTDKMSPSEQDSRTPERISTPEPEVNVKPEINPIYTNPDMDIAAKPEVKTDVEEHQAPTPSVQSVPTNLLVTQFLYNGVTPKLPPIFETVLTRLSNGEYAFKESVDLSTPSEAVTIITQLTPFVNSYNALYNQLFLSKTMKEALDNFGKLQTLVEIYDDMFTPKGKNK